MKYPRLVPPCRLSLWMAIIVGAASGTTWAEVAGTEHENTASLQNISVRAKALKAISDATNSYQRDRVNLGLLGRQNAFYTPITVVNYDEKAFADKQPRNMVDAIAKTDASVMAFGGESNTLQGLYVRGLQLDARQFSVNGLAGMYSAYSSPTAHVGAAQLIKGASSATVGMDPEGAVGSAVNIETKKAPNEGIYQFGLGLFGKNRWQPSVDIGRRFGDQQQFGVRFNGKYRDGNTMRHQHSEKTTEASINLDYRSSTLQASLDAVYHQRDVRGGRARIHDIQLHGFQLPAPPKGTTNLVPAWQRQANEDKTVQLTFDWLPSDWVALSGGIGHMESRYWGNFSQIRILDSAGNYYNGNYDPRRGTWSARGSQPVDFRSRTTSANLKARGYFQTGPVSHNWSSAFDYVQRSRDHDSGPRVNNTLMNGLNIYNPVLPDAPVLEAVNTQGADVTYTAPSLAIADTLGLFNEKLRLTVGGRFQWIRQSNHQTNVHAAASRFSPMLTAAWIPRSDWMVYGNYLEDLEPGAVDDEGNMSQPRVSRQLEMGVRKNWGNVVGTANIYQITRPTYWRVAGIYNGVAHKEGESQGQERIRGIELNAYANLWNKTLRPSIGLSYIKHDLIDAPTFDNRLAKGAQVASPRLIAKAAVEWDTPWVQGLTLNTGLQHYGKSYQDYAKTHAFPAYTLMDLGAKYTLKMRNHQTLTLRGGIDNLLNRRYWEVQRGLYDRSFALVGLPRTFWLKADYRF